MLKDHFYDIEIFPLKEDRGINIPFIDEGKDYIIEGDYYDSKNPGYRIATFSTHSYQGAGGIHFYGSIKVYTSVKEIATGYEVWKSWKDFKIPEESKDIRIDILRPLTQKEIDDEPYRWEKQWYKEGMLVNAFYREDEIVQIVKDHINELFKGKWVLNCDLWNTQEKIIIDN